MSTPIHVLVLPYVASDRVTPQEADEVYEIVQERLSGTNSDNTTVSYLSMVVEQAIKQVKEIK